MSDTSLKSQPPTRKRASTPRSRNGCITCKIRRLKCGEERPGCVRCSKSGWQCDGYEHTIDNSSASSSAGPTSTPSSSNLSRLLPRGSHSPGPSRSRSRSPGQPLLTSYSPQMPSQLDQEERRYFQSFIEESCINLQDSDIFFWKEAAIQASHNTPCVRHALVAIGALAKSSQKSASGHYFMDAALSVHREFALQQYQKALGALREAISTQENGDASQSTLISCLVLAFFDNFIGNSGFAVQHIRYARKVLYNISDRLRIPPADPSTDSVHQKITRLFLILDMQALFATGHDEDRTVVLTEPQIPNIVIPARFGSIEEAKRCRDLIMWESCTFKYRTSFSNFVTWQPIPQPDVDLRSYLINKIHFFHAALEPLLANQRLDIGCHPLRRGDSIKFDSIGMLIGLTLSLNAPETDSDALMPCFEYLFSLCQEILEYEANVDSTSSHEVYTFEVRTVGALSLIATKCRNSNLRRQAINLLLSSHRREWMYDSLLLGQVASFIVNVEEEGMDEIGYIPEESRVWGESMELDLQRRRALVKVRVGRKGTSQWSERIIQIDW